MISVSLKSITRVTLFSLTVVICCAFATKLDWNRSVKIIRASYYNVSTANILRCGKLCERQGKCAAVTFDARESKCYMHDTPVNANQTEKGSNGRYSIKNYPDDSKSDVAENTCDRDTQISVPTMHHKHGGCAYIIEKNECESSPCQNNATCNDKKNDYYCKCEAGYTGKNCSVEINECDLAPCENNGTCVDRVNDYFCNCTVGFTGRNCSNASCPADRGYKLWTYPDLALCIWYSLTSVVNHQDAVDQCGSNGGHLVLIENDNMRIHLVNMVQGYGAEPDEYTYLDGHKNTESTWIDWMGDEMTWLSWSSMTSYQPADHCMISNLKNEFHHVDASCPNSRTYLLCQIDI